MKNPFSHGESEYDKQVRRILRELETTDPGSEEYGRLVERLNKLQRMRAEDRPERLSPNTAAIVSANLLGIVMIIRHEQLNLITSKALGVLLRLK
jgi:hypothetical protein